MKKFYFTILFFFLISCSQNTTEIKPPWNVGSIMPTARSELASTIVKGNIYVAGGINFWGSSDSFEVYDIEKNSWEELPSLPESLNHIGMASADGKIYLSGGFFNMR